MWLCADLSDAYAFLRRRANLDDADERLRLAKWCHAQGLREEALAEVSAAVAIQPRQQEAQRLLRRLQQTAPVAPSTPTATTEPVPAVAPPVDVSAEAMNQFATRIQPILMNACVNCHGSGQGGSFKLINTHEHGSLVPKTTQQNLTSVLAQVNLDQPSSSPLLTKAGSVHGAMGEAPLAGRKMPAYHALEEWVRLTLANQPAAHDQSVFMATESSSKTTKPATPKTTVEKASAAKGEDAIAPSSEKTTPKEPADPFDPVIFNREARPDR
jgi:hypothetical protein